MQLIEGTAFGRHLVSGECAVSRDGCGAVVLASPVAGAQHLGTLQGEGAPASQPSARRASTGSLRTEPHHQVATARICCSEDELQHVGDVRRLTDALQAERARSARLDGELGYALLTVGRLRGRLRDAGIDPDELFGADLGADHEEGQ